MGKAEWRVIMGTCQFIFKKQGMKIVILYLIYLLLQDMKKMIAFVFHQNLWFNSSLFFTVLVIQGVDAGTLDQGICS